VISLARQLAIHQEVEGLFAAFAEACDADREEWLYRRSVREAESRRLAGVAYYQRKRSVAKGAGCVDCREPIEPKQRERCRGCSLARDRARERSEPVLRRKRDYQRRRRALGGAAFRAKEAARMRARTARLAKPFPTCLDCPAPAKHRNALRCSPCAKRAQAAKQRAWFLATKVLPRCLDCSAPTGHGNALRCETHRHEHWREFRRQRNAERRRAA
jgi:hypothetical protein